MKKIVTLLLCIALLASLVSCTALKPKKTPRFDITSLKTLGDLFALETESAMSGYTKLQYGCLFEYGGVYYRIYADLPEGTYDQMEAIDFFDEERDAKIDAILRDIEITFAEDMTPYIPTEKDLAKYVGKTGQQLFDADFWTAGYSLGDDEQYFGMGNDLYEFEVYFNERVELGDDDEDFDSEEAIKSLTVKQMKFTGFSGGALQLADEEEEAFEDTLTTLGDVLELDREDKAVFYNERCYNLLFCYEDCYYCVHADINKDVYDALRMLESCGEGKAEMTYALLANVKITYAEDMTSYIPTEDYLLEFLGETGQKLLDDGFWVSGYSFDGEEQVFYMEFDLCTFDVFFNEPVEVDNMDGFDASEAIKPLTVKGLVFRTISDRAVNPD